MMTQVIRSMIGGTMLCLALILFTGTLSLAAPITQVFDIEARNFGIDSPVDQVNGRFTVTWDPTIGDIIQDTQNVTVNRLNIPFDAPVFFNYLSSSGDLQIGSLNFDDNITGINAFKFEISNVPNLVPMLDVFVFSREGFNRNFAGVGTATVVSAPPTVVTMATALAIVGVFAWSRRFRKG